LINSCESRLVWSIVNEVAGQLVHFDLFVVLWTDHLNFFLEATVMKVWVSFLEATVMKVCVSISPLQFSDLKNWRWWPIRKFSYLGRCASTLWYKNARIAGVTVICNWFYIIRTLYYLHYMKIVRLLWAHSVLIHYSGHWVTCYKLLAKDFTFHVQNGEFICC